MANYNFYQTSFLPQPPSSVPSSSTITSISYSLDYTAPGFRPGVLDANLCSTTTDCTPINRFGGTTSYFNGRPATTSLQIRVRWSNVLLSGAIPGGVTVTDSITVNYS